MNISRRQLYAAGEPLGEGVTRLKPGGRIYGGGNDSPSETKQTSVAELPEWARGYAKDTLAKASALTDISKNPYQQYGGERIAGFQPMQQQAFESAATMQPSQQLGFGSNIAGAASLGALGANYQAGRFSGGQFGNRQAAQYMSPYIEQAMQPQLREAQRSSDILGQQQRAQAVGAGAFGGSRQAIIEAERERNLGQQQGDIRARGYQTAYEQAANQYNQDMARRMQAQQLGEQSRQYGAGLGLQGLQTALQGAGQLGQLGQTEYGQRMGITGLQSQLGTQQQQQAQRPLDMAYQDFINQQNYPYKQLGFMSDMVRGLPLGQQTTSQVYQGAGSTMGQLAGLGMGAYGLSRMLGDSGSKSSYADGGITSDQNVESILSKLSDGQLQQAKEAALNRRDAEQAQMIDAEIAHRANLRAQEPVNIGGIAPAISNEFADGMEQAMATGGIVAFADGKTVKEMPEKATSPVGDILDYLGITGGLNALRENYYKDKEFEKRTDAAESMYPGLTEALTPTERARRKAAGDVLFRGPQDVTPLSPEEIEAANQRVMAGSKKVPAKTEPAPAVNLPPKEAPVAEKKTAPARGLSEIAVKPSKADVKSAVAQFAEQNKLSSSEKEDTMSTILKMREELGKPDQPILDKLSAMIESQKPNEQAMKDKGFAQALAEYGFGVAARASRPGARALESFAAEAPTLSRVAAKTDELINARKDNYAKLQMDQAKYEVALAKSNMQTAATLAGQIRQGQQQDKMLQFQIAKAQDDLAMEKQKLAQQGAYQQGILSRQPETLQGLATALEKATPEQRKFLEQAATIRYGTAAGIGAVEKNKAAFISGMKEIDANYPPLLASRDPKTAAMREQAIRELRALTNMTGTEGSGSKVLRFNERGELIQ